MAARSKRANARGTGRLFFSFTAGWLIFATALSAQQPAGEQQIQDHLAAGEFGPAKAAAQDVGDARVRDRLLGDIAAAQANAGAKAGSLETAADISSDLARSGALQQVRKAAGSRWFGRGGGVQADFDPLIELITSTIEPDSWQDVGGPGSVSGFDGGVRVDALGLLRRMTPRTDAALETVRSSASQIGSSHNPRKKSVLRKISLNRLERELQLLQAAGKSPDETMKLLAGLQRIKYLLVYPETGDIVIAGPADDWRQNNEGRWVDIEKQRPIVQLDDLVVTFRNAFSAEPKFGCSINPTKPGLAEAQAVNDRWAAKGPMKPSQRAEFLEELRAGLGRQDIVVYGLDPQTRAARVMVEADYRMKLVGMGLEDGTLGVTSYLNSLDPKRHDLNNLSVLRWWFTLNYDSLQATESRDAFELKGPGVKVLSENEMLSEQGDRIHTGRSSEVNSLFAESFTKHFEILAAKYPVYAELRNVFDLALVAAVVRSHDLPGQVNWHLTHFGPDGTYEPELDFAPTKVDSVINHRIIEGKSLVAGVSGGVTVDARGLATKTAIKTDEYGLLKSERSASTPKELPRRHWWWD
ncbi:hypothetical protein ETAA8_61960 [Anatilimnocola aggregata]|uniref:DUF1598 domain-containing protein n=1 Tax=Anatilimnocola aggregata TaxID=2528021 RepID=A0A517YLG2_9BACT|nr:DUF1598 domain-containing protein [Anatilimnocola aggregata]QDU31043.1 hypothetical protein ETAA8_61960 [Anatilimnocola aggregata]